MTTDGQRESFGSAWTGGQWSCVRVAFGASLLAAPAWSPRPPLGPIAANSPMFIGVVASWILFLLVVLGFAAGKSTRVAALLLLSIGAWLAEVAPWGSTVDMAVDGLPLLACVIAPPAPFGSLAARGRIDPDGGWRLPSAAFALLWFGVAAGCIWVALITLPWSSWFGAAGIALTVPLAVFAPLALFRVTRPVAWLLLVVRSVVVMAISHRLGVGLDSIFTLLFLFDPAWLPPRRAAVPELVFFDGHCGLCHRLVRFVLSEDREGLFVFSTLQGEKIKTVLDDATRTQLPDSVVVRDDTGRVLVKSAAVVHVYDRLGGLWRVVALVLRVIPTSLRDLGYDVVAKVRHHLFARPADSCPLIPPNLKDRFVA